MCSTILLALLLTGSAFAADWTTPVPVEGVNTQYDDWIPRLSYDGLSLYFTRSNTDQFHRCRIYEARRSTPSGSFTEVREVLRSDYDNDVLSPWVSPDNLRMYYHEEANPWQIKVSQRASVNDPWAQGTALNLGSIANPSFSSLSQDELTIVLNTPSGPGGWDMYLATRPNIDSPFGNIQLLDELNTSAVEAAGYFSPDALTLYFHSNRNGPTQLFMATRPSLNDPFGNAQHLSFFDTPGGGSTHPSISSDGTALYFSRGLTGEMPDIYVSYLVPEPATIALFLLGIVALRSRKRSG